MLCQLRWCQTRAVSDGALTGARIAEYRGRGQSPLHKPLTAPAIAGDNTHVPARSAFEKCYLGRQFVLDDDGEPVYGEWLHPDEYSEPLVLELLVE
jgi:hypothetical protein